MSLVWLAMDSGVLLESNLTADAMCITRWIHLFSQAYLRYQYTHYSREKMQIERDDKTSICNLWLLRD